MGIIISQYKDPYKPIRIQWNVIRVFFIAAHMFLPTALSSSQGWEFEEDVSYLEDKSHEVFQWFIGWPMVSKSPKRWGWSIVINGLVYPRTQPLTKWRAHRPSIPSNPFLAWFPFLPGWPWK